MCSYTLDKRNSRGKACPGKASSCWSAPRLEHVLSLFPRQHLHRKSHSCSQRASRSFSKGFHYLTLAQAQPSDPEHAISLAFVGIQEKGAGFMIQYRIRQRISSRSSVRSGPVPKQAEVKSGQDQMTIECFWCFAYKVYKDVCRKT